MRESVLKSYLAIILIRKYFTQSLPDKQDGSPLLPNHYQIGYEIGIKIYLKIMKLAFDKHLWDLTTTLG